jgi:predicted ArsR family transcriptional regulator
MEPDKKFELIWTEEFILTLLRDSGEQSLKQLQGRTRLYKQTLKDTLVSLSDKGMVESRLLPGPRGRSELRYHTKGEVRGI